MESFYQSHIDESGFLEEYWVPMCLCVFPKMFSNFDPIFANKLDISTLKKNTNKDIPYYSCLKPVYKTELFQKILNLEELPLREVGEWIYFYQCHM